jgi:hypothetical protein
VTDNNRALHASTSSARRSAPGQPKERTAAVARRAQTKKKRNRNRQKKTERKKQRKKKEEKKQKNERGQTTPEEGRAKGKQRRGAGLYGEEGGVNGMYNDAAGGEVRRRASWAREANGAASTSGATGPR